jgi:hypothetical protein
LHVNEDGVVTPKQIKAGYDAEWVEILKVTDSRRRASLRAGAVGTRYSCVVDIYGEQREIYLFDEGLKWFVITNP